VILPARRHSTQAETKSSAERPRHSRAVSLRGRSWPRAFLRFYRPSSVAFSGVLVALVFGPTIAKTLIFVNEIRDKLSE
ncbi:hypothetical protein M5D96_002680, partial [Drosophila gunungcola]